MNTRNSNSRSLVLTQTELARMPGSDTVHLTNKSFSALLVYIGQQKREEVDEEMDVEENKKSNVEEEGEKKEAIVEGEKEEAMEQSSAKQCSAEEMLRRVQEDTFQPDIVTNSLVADVVRLQKKVETLQPSAATDFIIRSLGLVTNSAVKWKIGDCMKYTSARVSGRVEEFNQPWLYQDTVTSLASEPAGHPLVSLIARLQEIKVVATACLQCSSPPQYYCVRCVTAVYCSQDCMVEHWEEGHYMECGA